MCEGDTLKYCGANDTLQATTVGLCSGSQQIRYCDQGQLVVADNADKGVCNGDLAMICMMQNIMVMDCTETGASPPTATLPTYNLRDLRRTMGVSTLFINFLQTFKRFQLPYYGRVSRATPLLRR